MLSHANGRWRTECDRCRAPIEVIGAPDKRPSKSGSELTKAALFLKSLGWHPLYRKNAAWHVEWRCKACVDQIAERAKGVVGLALNFDPHGSTKKQA